MGDSKLKYQRSIKVLIQESEHRRSLDIRIQNAIRRYRLHRDTMHPVDLNEVIEKYAKGSTPYFENYKINFHTEGSDYIVVCDPAGYLRIKNLRSDYFVDCFTGKEYGDQSSLSTKEKQEKTHFRIKIREEMKK